MKHRYTESELEAAKAAFALAVKAMGSKGKLARGLGITKAAVSQWDVVPLGRVEEVERLSGISRSLLFPGYVAHTAMPD